MGTERLEDGWQHDTPVDDTILRAYTDGFADWMGRLAEATGSRTLQDDTVGALDSGSDFFLANGAMLRRPVRDHEWPEVVARLRDFYDGGPGGPWSLFCPWPTPDLGGLGVDLMGHPPFMVRAPGGTAPPDPPGLEVVEAHDDDTMRAFATALADGYPSPPADVFATRRVTETPGTRWWVGFVDGRPVATSVAHVHGGIVHVEFIATHPDVRGHGIGAAMTARAALADPSLPAALIASDPGQPVYERLGFLRIARFTGWIGARAGAQSSG